MEITNIPGSIKKYGLLQASDVLSSEDLVTVHKKTKSGRSDFDQYIDVPMTVAEFVALVPVPVETGPKLYKALISQNIPEPSITGGNITVGKTYKIVNFATFILSLLV